jgi:hypothetical protein
MRGLGLLLFQQLLFLLLSFMCVFLDLKQLEDFRKVLVPHSASSWLQLH